jgi:hypothetical protein
MLAALSGIPDAASTAQRQKFETNSRAFPQEKSGVYFPEFRNGPFVVDSQHRGCEEVSPAAGARGLIGQAFHFSTWPLSTTANLISEVERRSFRRECMVNTHHEPSRRQR